MKNLIYIVLLLLVLGCSAKKDIVKESEKRDLVEKIDLSAVEQSSLLIKQLLDNSIISIELTPTSSDASYKSDSSGVETKGMRINVNIQKDVQETTTQIDTTRTETRSEQREDKTVIKKKDKKVDRKQPVLLYVSIIIAFILAIIVYNRIKHVTDR